MINQLLWYQKIPPMILLDEKTYPLVNHHLESIYFNHLFAKAVLERSVSGRVYVDDAINPRTFYIVHRYGMSLLGGSSANPEFNSAFKEYALNLREQRTGHEWMQVFPLGWENVLKDLFKNELVNAGDSRENTRKGQIEFNTRVNFKFSKQKFLAGKKISPDGIETKIIENTATAYDEMTGSVVPSLFWNSSHDFRAKGVAFGLYVGNQLAALSFSSFVAPGKLELGIETKAEFRGRGFAEEVCAALIDYCLERDLEPIWSCRLENTGSYRLAQKLGFEPSLELPYYRLSD